MEESIVGDCVCSLIVEPILHGKMLHLIKFILNMDEIVKW